MSTEEESDYQRVYTGPEVNVNFLDELLNKEGIATRIRNDFESGLRGGFGGGLPGQVMLFVDKPHYDMARKIAKDTFPKDFKDGE